MPDFLIREFTIANDDFDSSLLPAKDRHLTGFAKGEAISNFLGREFQHYEGTAEITASAEKVQVRWGAELGDPDLLAQIVNQLQFGRYPESIQMLQLLLSADPANTDVLYNLGMALSDVGRLEEAITYLSAASALAPDFTNVGVALGVAHSRAGHQEQAESVLQVAVQQDPGNMWAHRNLGAVLLKMEKVELAVRHLEEAVSLSPQDQQALFGLGQGYSLQNRSDEADECFRKAIEADSFSEVAQMAKEARSAIAAEKFASSRSESGRMDAVFYCLAAIEKFSDMSPQEIQAVAFEIAQVGMHGLDVNDPDPKYRLKTLPGTYTGLQMVSYMYAGFKIFAPHLDVGFDLSAEYSQAQQIANLRKQQH